MWSARGRIQSMFFPWLFRWCPRLVLDYCLWPTTTSDLPALRLSFSLPNTCLCTHNIKQAWNCKTSKSDYGGNGRALILEIIILHQSHYWSACHPTKDAKISRKAKGLNASKVGTLLPLQPLEWQQSANFRSVFLIRCVSLHFYSIYLAQSSVA